MDTSSTTRNWEDLGSVSAVWQVGIMAGQSFPVYVSEGRDRGIISRIAAAGAASGAVVCNTFVDPTYNRTGRLTLASADAAEIEGGVDAVCHEALQTLDLRKHVATHPRLGVVDHVACNPLGSATSAEAAELAARIGARLGDGAGGASPVPVFFYGAAREDLRPLAELRRCLGYFSGAAKGEWCGLSEDMKQAMVQLPADRGPVGQVDDRHGVAVVGAVPWVHNYNLLIVADLEEVELMRRCRRIAKSISERGGGLDKVETMALPHEKGVEVACNLLDADITPPAKSSAAWALSALLVPAVEAALAVTRQEPGDIMEASAEGDEAFLNKFSRQNAAFGAEVTMKMTKMRALVVGCSGVAVEIVKNLVLQGLGAVSALREFHSTCDKAATCRLTLALHMALQCGYALHHT
eukprot:s1622_g13.t2